VTFALIAKFVYAIFIFAGGIFGYFTAGSLPSLIAGLLGGGLLMLAAVLQWNEIDWGLTLARIITLSLIFVFIQRWLKTRKFMPAGLMVGAGALALASMFNQR
jgi:uncharacterized membrane protein (UPF0136 family)